MDRNIIDVSDSENVQDTIIYSTGDGEDDITGFQSGEDKFDTDFATSSGDYTFAGLISADNGNPLALDTADFGEQQVAATIGATNMSNTSAVISLISDGTITLSANGDLTMLSIEGTDDSNSYLYEVHDTNSDGTVQNTEMTLIGTFNGEFLDTGDII